MSYIRVTKIVAGLLGAPSLLLRSNSLHRLATAAFVYLDLDPLHDEHLCQKWSGSSSCCSGRSYDHDLHHIRLHKSRFKEHLAFPEEEDDDDGGDGSCSGRVCVVGGAVLPPPLSSS
jgi:hypothetical protein